MRQAYRQRVLPAHWATKFEATFNHAAKAAPLGSPFGVDRGPTVVITDTGNNLSTNGAALVCAGGAGAGDPGLWDIARTRIAGRAVLGRLTITDATQITEFGWDSNQSGALAATGFRCAADVVSATVGGVVNPALFIPADATAYDLGVVALDTGALLLRKLSTASQWTLLYRSATGTTTPVYAALSNNNAALTLDDWRVVDLPGAWASDAGLRLVNVAVPPSVTPTVGPGELLTDPGLEAWTSATNLTSWTENIAGMSTVNQDAAVFHGGANAARLDVDASGSIAEIYQAATAPAGTWILVSAWLKASASGKTARLEASTGAPFLGVERNPGTTWTQYAEVFRFAAANQPCGVRRYNATSGSIYIDDLSVQIIALPTMLGTAYQAASEGWFEVGVTIPTGHVGGMMICLDDETNPQNYLLIYHDRTNLNVIECVAGVQTSLLATACTYGAARRICVQKVLNTMRCYYNDVLIGAALTTTATTNTKMATFSSDVSVTFVDLAYIAAYHTLPAWA